MFLHSSVSEKYLSEISGTSENLIKKANTWGIASCTHQTQKLDFLADKKSAIDLITLKLLSLGWVSVHHLFYASICRLFYPSIFHSSISDQSTTSLVCLFPFSTPFVLVSIPSIPPTSPFRVFRCRAAESFSRPRDKTAK